VALLNALCGVVQSVDLHTVRVIAKRNANDAVTAALALHHGHFVRGEIEAKRKRIEVTFDLEEELIEHKVVAGVVLYRRLLIREVLAPRWLDCHTREITWRRSMHSSTYSGTPNGQE